VRVPLYGVKSRRGAIMRQILGIIKSGQLTQHDHVERFEHDLAKYLGVDPEYVVATSSGTAALHLAIRSFAGIGAYIVPDISFIATANALLYEKKLVMLRDVSLTDLNLEDKPYDDPVLGVDLYGNPCTTKNIEIEDAAQALGSTYKGKKCGTLGKIGCFSFHATKIVTTGGEGGAVVCKELGTAQHIRAMRQQFKSLIYPDYEGIGYNYRMTEIQAAYGTVELEELDQRVDKKNEIHFRYWEELKDLFGFIKSHNHSNVWHTVIFAKHMGIRKAVESAFDSKGIGHRRVFKPLHEYSWINTHPSTVFPNANIIYNFGICLPSYPSLTDRQVMYVINTLKEVMANGNY